MTLKLFVEEFQYLEDGTAHYYKTDFSIEYNVIEWAVKGKQEIVAIKPGKFFQFLSENPKSSYKRFFKGVFMCFVAINMLRLIGEFIIHIFKNR